MLFAMKKRNLFTELMTGVGEMAVQREGMDVMSNQSIHNDQDYRAALKELSLLFDREPDPRTPEGERFERLIAQVGAYEAKNFPLDLPSSKRSI